MIKTNQNKKILITIVGIGDFGIKAIEPIAKMAIPNVNLLDVNTDWAFLGKNGNLFIRIGKKTTLGIGTGAHPEFGMSAAEEDEEAIANNLKGSNLVILVAGLGGGTGSGATPVFAKIAKSLNIPTIVFATTPYNFESKIRHKTAKESVEKLKSIATSLKVISCEETYRLLVASNPKTPILKFFEEVAMVLQNKILSAIESINLQTSKGKPIQKVLTRLNNQ